MIWIIAGGVMLGGMGLFLLCAIILIAFVRGGGVHGRGMANAAKAALGIVILAMAAWLAVLTA